MPAAVVKDGTVTPKFRQGKISPPFLTAKFSPRNSPLAKFSPPMYIKIAVVVQGGGDGKQVLGRLRPQLAYVQRCRWVTDLHDLYSDEEGLQSDLPPQVQACRYEIQSFVLAPNSATFDFVPLARDPP